MAEGQEGPLRGRLQPAAALVWRRQRHAQLSAAWPSQPFFGCLCSLTIQRHAIRGEVPFVQRHEDALHTAIGRPLGAQQHAGLASRRASKRREDSDVLIGPIRQQPAARQRALGVPMISPFSARQLLCADGLPASEARPGEHDVGREICRRTVNDGRKRCRHQRRPPRETFQVDAS